ncbi:hypothetical protein FAM09_17720 [Niastella caeni]|uniref:Uncharacterized protein n=1 Tax=Niastella caeni TaxID=2569763 RepID=A0A4S8HTW5_9BACT|nr:hypothetical protein [Niastella caeni]THU38501.1 hypothetical protein FAM09_17720 [Niastella caeni]
MKKTIFITAFLLSVSFGRAQNIDSMFAEPQVIELTISTPQPRLKETFQISLDINHLRTNIFKSLAGKVKISNDINVTDREQFTLNVNALKTGKNEIGPLEFYLNKTKYTTNKIIYDVIEALPNTDNGLWFRKVMTSDSTFCIIIEQRIPANNKTTQTSNNSISFTTEPLYTDIAKFKDSYSIEGVNSTNSHSNTNFSSVEINGHDKQFMYGYSVYYFNIVNRKAKIKITKDKFTNLPVDYNFEDIVIP